MTTWTAGSFLGGHPALDFVNTVGGRTKDRGGEWLCEFVDAIDWAHAADLLNTVEHEHLLTHAEHSPEEADQALAELHGQREALHRFLLAAIENTDCPPPVRERVKADITGAYRDAHLSDRFRSHDAWIADAVEIGVRVVAVRVALASAALLASDQRTQLGACGRCSWLFLDPSPSKRRRWCSMTTCGNRAKAQRHQQR